MVSMGSTSLSASGRSTQCGPKFAYPQGYQANSLLEQARILINSLDGVELSSANERFACGQLPEGAEAWFVALNWKALGWTYEYALVRVLGAIAKQRQFFSYRRGSLGVRRIRFNESVADSLNSIASRQNRHLLVVPAQFGCQHFQSTVSDMLVGNQAQKREFPLDALSVAVMILTNPGRFSGDNDLSVVCAGTRYKYLGAEDPWSFAPIFRFSGGRLTFDVLHTNMMLHNSGIVTGFRM